MAKLSEKFSACTARVSLGAVLALTMALPGFAQSSGEGPSSITETFQDWVVQCATRTQDGETVRTCQMSQDLNRRSDGRRVLSVAIQKTAEDGTPVVRFITPLGVLLGAGLGVDVDGEEVLRFGYQTCLPAGCVSQGTLEETVITAFRRGAEADVKMRAANGEDTNLTVSLSGFSAAWARIDELS